MTTKKAIIWTAGMTVAAAAYSAYMYPSLPNPTPIHWNFAGEPDGFERPIVAAMWGPGLMIFMMALMLVLPKISPKNFRIEPFRGAYNYLMVLLVALFGALHALTLQTALTPGMRLGDGMLVLIFVFFALLGNMLGKVRKNFWIGVRTPWTLASDPVWNATHRATGRLWVATGVIGTIGILLGAPNWLVFGILIAAALWPIVHSYLLYRKLENGNGAVSA